ncbi:hypothetical protein BurMR1_1874 [Burkholderia sp. MR1]|nr:hypothetical protein BurMR1_1874 [Burkholderia sp. MR1]
MQKQLVLLDDGKFFIERNCNGEAATTNGFLLRRCPVSLTTPSGYECIGGYECAAFGQWRASINAPYDEETDSDCRELGFFEAQLDAITVLWKARQDAYCQH